MAGGLGCHGEYVDRIEDFDGALARCRAADGPSLVCVRSDRAANLATPAAMGTRFHEVYEGPIGEPVLAGG